MIAFFTPKRILRYVMMPEIGARLHALFMGGFGYVPYLIAVVYNMVGLLPNSHPYLLSTNISILNFINWCTTKNKKIISCALMNNFLKFDLCKHIFPGTTFFSEETSAVCLKCYCHARRTWVGRILKRCF